MSSSSSSFYVIIYVYTVVNFFDSFRVNMEKGPVPVFRNQAIIIYVYTVVNPPPDNSGHMQINSRPWHGKKKKKVLTENKPT
jgi:hypothetical protein